MVVVNPCSVCNGVSGDVSCTVCLGHGYIESCVQCPACSGTGSVDSSPAPVTVTNLSEVPTAEIAPFVFQYEYVVIPLGLIFGALVALIFTRDFNGVLK